jgi:hypothetical protein
MQRAHASATHLEAFCIQDEVPPGSGCYSALQPTNLHLVKLAVHSLPAQVVVTLADRKGDTLNYPKAVLALPFSEDSSTAGGQYADDYAVVCGQADADAGGAPVSLQRRCGNHALCIRGCWLAASWALSRVHSQVGIVESRLLTLHPLFRPCTL